MKINGVEYAVGRPVPEIVLRLSVARKLRVETKVINLELPRGSPHNPPSDVNPYTLVRLKCKRVPDKSVIKVLVTLYELGGGPIPVHRIGALGVGMGTAYNAIRKAEEYGLVVTKSCYSTTCVELTELGRKVGAVASLLVDMLASIAK